MMREQINATYIGKQQFLKGKTAIIMQTNKSGLVRAQFDDLTLPLHLTHNWTHHLTADFAVSLDEFLKTEAKANTVASPQDDWQEYLDQYGPQFNV